MKILNAINKFYVLGTVLILAITTALIFNSLPGKKSIAQTMKSRVLGISDEKSTLAVAIKIIDNENVWTGVSDKTEISEIVKNLEVPLYSEDLVTAFPDPKLKIGTTITINRAPIVYLRDGLDFKETRSWQKTVAAYLSEKKILLGPMDQINLSPDSILKNRDAIVITRIGERDEPKEELIPFAIVNQQTTDLYKGETKLTQKGIDGKKVKTYRLRYENNALVSKTLINDEITVKPQSQITLIGTKPKITVACRFNDTVELAAAKYGLDPNGLCRTMMCESHGNPYSDGGDYKGLFQYTLGLWADLSPRAGYSGASIWDATAQIYTTAWAWAHGYRGRWPNC